MARKKSRKSVTAASADGAEASTSTAAVANAPSPIAPGHDGVQNVRLELRNRKCMQREPLRSGTHTPTPGITLETSPMRHSASNRKEGEPHTRAYIDAALKEELWDARYLSDDLNDLMFRSHISTEFAGEVLEGLLGAGAVTVRKEVGNRKHVVRKGSPDATAAIKNAYERALVHACQRDGLEQVKSPSKPRGSDKVLWKWSWNNFPKAPLKERALVDFLNRIIDTSLSLPCMKGRKVLYRFAVPHDTNHAYPLSHTPDKTDLRPDFVVLPVDAFADKKSKKKAGTYESRKEWDNFTTVRLTGECKNSDSASGVHQVQGYMRATRRAQPWLRFVTAMAVTREVVNFMRGDASGMERITMRLEHGRSCLEFDDSAGGGSEISDGDFFCRRLGTRSSPSH
ncbi:hypothetical protein F5I97DRAFT_776695 [Phlebopus sp. FC_14]|nr:hypothetical protein F5I97DRAFT_776695 [Phlebopus sp. FC_14]